MKKPIVAALLNIYPGLGYLYLDAKQFIGWLVYFTFTFAAIGFYETTVAAADRTPYSMGHWLWLATVLVLWAALIVDAYRSAGRKQESFQPTNEQSIALTGIWVISRTYARQNSTMHQPVQLFTPRMIPVS